MLTEFLQIVIGGLQVGCIYSLIALGFSLVYRVTNVINLSQGAYCLLGALTAYWFEAGLGWSLVGAALASVLLTTLVGMVFGILAFVPGLAKLSNANMLMMTAGLLTLLEGAILVIWGSQPYALTPFSGQVPVAAAGLLIPTQEIWIVASTAAIIGCMWYVVQRTKIGKALRACGENPTAATLMGISVRNMQLVSVMGAAIIGAISGLVSAPAMSVQFDTGRLFTIQGFIAVAIGGLASFPAAIVGGLLLGVVNQIATAYISSLFSNTISLVLLLGVLLFRPSGLIGAKSSRRQDVREEPRVWKHVTRLPFRSKLMMVALGLLVALLIPYVVSQGAIFSSLVIAAIFFVALMGLDLVMGYAGQVSLGQAGFMAIGGYTVGYLTTQQEVSPALALLAGVGIAVVSAVVLSLITMRLRGLYLALATLAFGLLIDSCAVGLADITGGPSGLVGIPSFAVGDFEFASPISMYYLVLAVIVVVLIMLGGLISSGFGRSLQAIRTDQMAASALGIKVVQCKLIAFSIAAALAALAGGLYAFFFHFLSPDMLGTQRSLELVSMLVIGGEGTLVGGLFGAVLLTLLPAVFQPLAQWKTFASGALLVVSFLHLPEGIWGTFAHWISKVGKTRVRIAADKPIPEAAQ